MAEVIHGFQMRILIAEEGGGGNKIGYGEMLVLTFIHEPISKEERQTEDEATIAS